MAQCVEIVLYFTIEFQINGEMNVGPAETRKHVTETTGNQLKAPISKHLLIYRKINSIINTNILPAFSLLTTTTSEFHSVRF